MKKHEIIKTDICIIGGGASGLAAAVSVLSDHEENPDVIILEKKDSCAAKIKASGNGRCNLSNLACEDWENSSVFFSDLGLLTRSDEQGRIYPYSEDARDVADCLIHAAKDRGARILTNSAALSVEKTPDGFEIRTESARITSSMLLIAAGGKAAPKLGTSGDGYTFAKKLGHTVSRLIPALAPVTTKQNIKAMNLSGIRSKCSVSLLSDGKEIFKEYGEVQFTEYGISGICVFNLSRCLLIPEGRNIENGFDDYEIRIDFLPEYSPEQVSAIIKKNADNTEFNLRRNLVSLVKAPIAEAIAGQCKTVSEAVSKLKSFTLNPSGVKGWQFAQVTKGGVIMPEIYEKTMESRLVKGLYFAGEILDFEGPCGGFNLQHAWTTGIKAGKAMKNEFGRTRL